MLVTAYEYAGSDYADGVVHDYEEESSYYACDGCGDTESTLYVDGKKHYCVRCMAINNWDEFTDCYRDEIISEFANDYVEGCEVVDRKE